MAIIMAEGCEVCATMRITRIAESVQHHQRIALRGAGKASGPTGTTAGKTLPHMLLAAGCQA
eukprot:5030258-Pleurochrysis_carterae.AAC.1